MNKKFLILIIATLGLLLLGFVGFSALTDDQNDSSDSQSADAPTTVEIPVPDDLTPTTREESFEYTDAVISPDTIANNPNAYVEKTISTRGWITEISPGEYLVLSVNSDELFGLQLATNANIDFKNYIDPSADVSKESKPVNLTGELTISEVTNSLVFLVSTLTE